METADMVKVAVSAAPYSIDKPYSYLVPEALSKRKRRVFRRITIQRQ